MDVVTLGAVGTSAYGLRYGILHIESAQIGNTAVANVLETVTIRGTYRDVSNAGQSINQSVDMSVVDPGCIDVAVPAPGRYAVIFGMYSDVISEDIMNNPLIQQVTINAGQCKTVKQLTTHCWQGIKNIINAHKEKVYFKACDILPQDCDLFLATEKSGTNIRYAIEVATVDTLPNHPHAVVFNTVQVLPHKTTMYVNKNKANNQTGYKFTNVAKYLDDTFFHMLPADLQKAITPREFVGASGAAKKKTPTTELHNVWAPTFGDLSPMYSNAEMLRWSNSSQYPDNNEYTASIGFQASSIDISVQNVSKIIYDSDKSMYRPGSWGKAIKYPHYAKPVAGSATLTTYATSKNYSLPSEIDLCRIKTVEQLWVVPFNGLDKTATASSDVPRLFTMKGCQYWTATPDRTTATKYWVCNSSYTAAALASTASSGISAASTYAKNTPAPLGMMPADSNLSYNILPYFMIAADDEFISG